MLPAGVPLLEETIALAKEWRTAPELDGTEPRKADEICREKAQEAQKLGEPESGNTAESLESCVALGEAWEADFLLLKLDGDGRIRLHGGCVCFPSSWRLTEKMGRPLEEIHDPVPTLNASLAPSIASFLSRLRPGPAWLRSNWGMARTPELNLHPDRQMPRLTLPLEAGEVWVRIENQALVLLPQSRGILFGIRLEILSLAKVKSQPAAARGLHRALRTMPESIAEYKGLAAARGELLRMLE